MSEQTFEKAMQEHLNRYRAIAEEGDPETLGEKLRASHREMLDIMLAFGLGHLVDAIFRQGR